MTVHGIELIPTTGESPYGVMSRWAARNHGRRTTATALVQCALDVVVDNSQLGITYRRGDTSYQGFVHVRSDSDDALRAALDARMDRRPVNAERVQFQLVDRIVVIPPPNNGAIKRISTLSRRPDQQPDQFRSAWLDHIEHVQQMPGIRGYIQNHVITTDGAPAARNGVDGVVELWFDDTEALSRAFSSPAGDHTMQHATTFIDAISTYLVRSVGTD